MNNIFARIEMPNTLPDSRVRIFPFLRNNQSTFNLFLIPEGRGSDGKKIFSYVDNEQIKTKNWFGAKNLSIQDVMKIFEEWASGAPIVFEMDAVKIISKYLESKFRK